MGFDGLRVLSLESRRATEIEQLIRKQGGKPHVAPSMREIPLADNPEPFTFASRLMAGEFDMVICMTGSGITFLRDVLTPHMGHDRIAAALRRATIVSRGPKPVGILRALGVPDARAKDITDKPLPDIVVPE